VCNGPGAKRCGNGYGNGYRDEKGVSWNTQALRKNGETFAAMAYSVPIVTNNRVVGIRGFVLDISERKRWKRPCGK